MKTLRDLVPLDEYEQDDLAMEKIKLEANFYKEIYHKRLNHFINDLIEKYKSSTVKIEYQIVPIPEIGALMTLSFIITTYIHEYDTENFIRSTITISVNQIQQFDYFPHAYNEQEIENLLLKTIDKLNKIKYE